MRTTINANLLIHLHIQQTILQQVIDTDTHNTVLTDASLQMPELGGLFGAQVSREAVPRL